MSTLDAATAPIWERLSQLWPGLDWSNCRIVHGAFHHVALLGGTAAVRVATGISHEQRSRREMENLETVGLLQLPIPTPSSLSAIHTENDWSANATSFIPGRHANSKPWVQVREPVTELLATLSSVSLPTGATLRQPHEWCGGLAWPEAVEQATCKLDVDLQSRAARVVEDVLEVERSAPRTFVHGDFGLHNLLWVGNTLSGIIDFDHACIGDPALDIAPLIGVFGSAAVADIADAETIERAKIHRATLSLQVAAAAHLAGDTKLRDHALGNFASRVRNNTLYDLNPALAE